MPFDREVFQIYYPRGLHPKVKFLSEKKIACLSTDFFNVSFLIFFVIIWLERGPDKIIVEIFIPN